MVLSLEPAMSFDPLLFHWMVVMRFLAPTTSLSLKDLKRSVWLLGWGCTSSSIW